MPRIGSVGEFNTYFGEAEHVNSIHDLDGIDFLIFWGGADVSPELFGEENVRSFPDLERDRREVPIYREALLRHIPMLGICRGAQFLCVMNGGRLWQHVDNHGRSHPITTSEGEEFVVTSTHHQMMRPDGMIHELLGWSSKVLSVIKEDDQGQHSTLLEFDLLLDREPEVVYFPVSNCLCVQGHPEYLLQSSPFTLYVRNLIKEKLNVAL